MMEFNPNPSGETLFLKRCPSQLTQTGPIRKMALLAIAVLCCGAANAKTVYVNDDIVTPGNGNSWATAFKYLRDALAVTGPNDQIWMTKGTYYPDDTTGTDKVDIFGDREIYFDINGQQIYGCFVGTETSVNQRDLTNRNVLVGTPPLPVNQTILSGLIWPGTGEDIQSSLHVAVVDASSTLDGITVDKGYANGSLSWTRPRIPFYDQGGGCFVSEGKVLTLRDCTFSNNRSMEFGGAIMVENGATNLAGNVVATNCIFDLNTVTSFHLSTDTCAGGAISGKVTATSCKFTGNKVTANPIDFQTKSAADGGAIFGVATVINCDFTGNTVTANGGTTTNIASGGAISGPVQKSKNCTFTANTSTAFIAYGGGIRGTIEAVNFVFSANIGTTGNIDVALAGTGLGGGGALYTAEGSSTLVNCVFVGNRSSIRGGAIVGAYVSETTNLTIMDSTFLDNGVIGRGAALSCMGIVRIANNIFWNTVATAGGFDQGDLINVTNRGLLRNAYVNYPVPPDQAQNVVKLGTAAITEFQGADIYLGAPLDSLVVTDPLFFAPADPDGLDNIWRTADDGLRLKVGSSAIGTARDTNLTYRNFLVADTLDIDNDGNITELTPADIAAYSRVQNAGVGTNKYLDMGAYEFGDLLNAPDISVEYPAATILVDGSATAVDFSALAGIPTTFTIKNLGGSDLTGLAITVDGVDAASFKVTQPVTNVVASGASTTFTVTFAPTVIGMRNAALHIASIDPDENPFDINVKGSAPLPDIEVEQPSGTPLVDDTSTIAYGNVGLSETLVKTFTIRNSGTGNLGIIGITSTGTNAANFTISGLGSTLLAPGAFTTFDVTFSPAGTGARNATIVINNSDPDAESSFAIKVSGTGVGVPEIVVNQPFSPELLDGSTNDFGSVERPSTYSKTFYIKNTGTATLKNIVVTITGSTDFSKTAVPVTSVAAGGKTSFVVTFKPSSAGNKTAQLQIKSNDADESQIDITLIGTGVAKSTSRKNRKALADSPAITGSSAADDGNSATTVTVSKSDGLKYLVLTIEKPADWSSAKHTVQVSPNLVDWFSGSKHTTTLVDNANVLQVRDNTPVKAGEKRYIRLK